MNKIYEESNYYFDFTNSLSGECLDKPNVQGLSAVDFMVETETYLLFIEIKNPDNPRATEASRREFLKDLQGDVFPLAMGMKFKDSVLKKYALAYEFEKPIKYIIVLQFDIFTEKERGILREKVLNYIPTGLTNEIFSKFTKVDSFEILTATEFSEKYFTATKIS